MTLPTKNILRAEALQKLTHLSIERRQEAAAAAFTFLIDHFLENPTPILSFCSKPLEINLFPFNEYLMKEGKLFLPRYEEGSLTIYQVESLEELSTSSFSIHEPNPDLCRKVNLEEICLVLVPGLCFDSFYHRVGYGKGLFDKLLSTLPQAKKWGIGFKEQWVEKIQVESHDVKIDKVFLF